MLLRQTIALSTALTLIACAQQTTTSGPEQATTELVVEEPAGPTGPVKVGLLLPLSGNAAAIGQDMLDAAQIAIFDVGDSDMVLLPRDTQGNRSGALAAAQSAIDDGAELIIGPLFSTSTAAISPLARENNLTVLSFSNDASVAGNGTYVMGFRPEEQVDRIIKYAQDQGYTRTDAVAPDNSFGERAISAWREAIRRPQEDRLPEAQEDPPQEQEDPPQEEEPQVEDDPLALAGVTIKTQEYRPASAFYAPDESTTTDIIRKITKYDTRQEALEEEKALLEEREDEIAKTALEQLEQLDTLGDPPFDSILVADSGSRLRSVVALLTYYDVDPAQVRLLGTMSWQDDQQVLNESTLQNSWFASVNPEERSSFASRFRDYFGREPSALAGLSYDATALAAVVALSDRSFPEDILTDSVGFIGQSGIFRLRPDGATDHGLAVLQIRSGDLEVIDPAPSSFTDTLIQ